MLNRSEAAAFHDLRALSVDGAGNCYVLDGDALRRVGADGSVTTLETIVIPDFYPPRAGCFWSSAVISGLVASRSGEVYLLGESVCVTLVQPITVGETATRIYHGVGTDRHLEVNATIGLTADSHGLIYSATTNQVLRFIPAGSVVLSFRSQTPATGGALLSIISPPGRPVRLEQSRDFRRWETRQTIASTGQDTLEVKPDTDRLFLRAAWLP